MSEKYYLSVAEEQHVWQKVGACRFYGSVYPLTDLAQFEEYLAKTRELYPDATHYVYAYRFGGEDNLEERYSDDGEPANSSGPPVLQSIRGQDLTNTLVVVTRYFGGVKQGVGGLIRAYGSTATLALEHSNITRHVEYRSLMVENIQYSELGDVLHFIERFRGEVKNIFYDAVVKVECEMQPDYLDEFAIKVRDITRGQGNVVLGDFLWKVEK